MAGEGNDWKSAKVLVSIGRLVADGPAVGKILLENLSRGENTGGGCGGV